jgi:hypothetical protein
LDEFKFKLSNPADQADAARNPAAVAAGRTTALTVTSGMEPAVTDWLERI